MPPPFWWARPEDQTPGHVVEEKAPSPNPAKEAKPRRIRESTFAHKPLPEDRPKPKAKSRSLKRLLKKRARK
ncbi:MAG: hypothetical protein Tp176DCM1853251_2 [Prokaryotic dsDNA virus sp.]|nr:MAG: hypothetical protein Tp176DCM1853251_2 [Prokaryotic dsDNA virus sp.]